MEIKKLLRKVELFDRLSDDDLDQVAAICSGRKFDEGEILANQGEVGRELFIISEGLVEVIIRQSGKPIVVVNLGAGQIIGEMSLVDRGPRSATVKAVQGPTFVQAIMHDDFHELCQKKPQIGYKIMLNIAADLSFKLRHSNLSEN